MRVEPGGDQVRLQGAAELEMNQASVRGDEIILDVGAGVSELRGVEATGEAWVRFFPGADNPAAAAETALGSDGEVEPLDDEAARLPGMDSEVASDGVAGANSADVAGVAAVGSADSGTSPPNGDDEDGDTRLLRGDTIRIEFAIGELAALEALSGRLGSPTHVAWLWAAGGTGNRAPARWRPAVDRGASRRRVALARRRRRLARAGRVGAHAHG